MELAVIQCFVSTGTFSQFARSNGLSGTTRGKDCNPVVSRARQAKLDALIMRCVRNPAGLISTKEQAHLPNVHHDLRMLQKHHVLTRLCRGAYAETKVVKDLARWESFSLNAKAVGSSRGRVLAGYSAAAVLDLWMYESHPQFQELYRQGGGRPIAGNVKQFYSRLDLDEITTSAGFSATSVERTIVDLCRKHGFGAGFVAACSALRDGTTSAERLGRYVTSSLYGVGDLRLILKHATGEVESALEAIFLAQVVDFGDFKVSPQVLVIADDGHEYRVDFGVKGSFHAVELDGKEKYGDAPDLQHFNLAKEKGRADALTHGKIKISRFDYAAVMKGDAYQTMLRRLGLPPRAVLPVIHF